jgi:hypothetical protein
MITTAFVHPASDFTTCERMHSAQATRVDQAVVQERRSIWSTFGVAHGKPDKDKRVIKRNRK